jgi:tRNA threonylcarbamoyladenosine biosynthesis protein TsaE
MRVDEASDALVIELDDEPDTDRLGRAIAEAVIPGTVIGLEGPLGAGKTRLARAIAEALGVDPRAVSSPTFVLIHEYEGRLPVYHFDAYRLAGPGPFEALGVADYWDAGGVCLVEWADLVAGALPATAWRLRIVPTGPTTRRVLIPGIIPARLVEALKHHGAEL